MKISVQQLRYLLKTAETRSMTEAAKDLSISQAALSNAISQVEREIGFKIFKRENRGVVPTQKGIEVLGYARRVVAGMDAFETHFDGKKAAPRKKFTIASNSMKITVAAFNQAVNREQFADYELKLEISPFLMPIDDVVTGAADICALALDDGVKARALQAMKGNGLEFHELLKAPLFAFMHSSHPLAGRPEVSREDLAPYPGFSPMHIDYLSNRRRASSSSGDSFIAPDDIDISDIQREIAPVGGYTVWCQLFPIRKPNKDRVVIPIEPAEYLTIGYAMPAGAQLEGPAAAVIDGMRAYGEAALRKRAE